MTGERVTNASLERTLGRIEQKLDDMDKKVDHNCQVSIDGDKAIVKKIDEYINRHCQYHKTDEEKWGFYTYMKNHLRMTIAAAILTGLSLTAFFGLTAPKVIAWVKMVSGAVK